MDNVIAPTSNPTLVAPRDLDEERFFRIATFQSVACEHVLFEEHGHGTDAEGNFTHRFVYVVLATEGSYDGLRQAYETSQWGVEWTGDGIECIRQALEHISGEVVKELRENAA